MPLHYFRGLRRRGVDVWLLTHARVRDELTDTLKDDVSLVVFIEDTWLHRICWRIGSWMPERIGWAWEHVTLGLATQYAQRAIVRRMVKSRGIRVIHQPTPVSPRAPSLMFGLGAPVIIGPMNGGMEYPPAYRRRFEGVLTRVLVKFGRVWSHLANLCVPGKYFAARLLVANERTRRALPLGCKRRAAILVENGVLDVDSPELIKEKLSRPPSPASFVFVGRLIDWKGVDLLLEAFAQLTHKREAALNIIGDGSQRPSLEALARRLGIERQISFRGFRPREECLEAIRGATALVLPSLLECGGAVVLEAMSVATPVIAMDWGGPSDYVDSACGVLIPPQTAEDFITDLARAMEKLANDRSFGAELGCRGSERARRCFTWDAKIDQILDQYASVTLGTSPAEIQPNETLTATESRPR